MILRIVSICLKAVNRYISGIVIFIIYAINIAPIHRRKQLYRITEFRQLKTKSREMKQKNFLSALPFSPQRYFTKSISVKARMIQETTSDTDANINPLS